MQKRMTFRWDDLRLFLAAYRTRSLTAGARKLGLNQSTMSRRLGAFESALGARLFDRTPEGLVATALAELLLPPAEKAEEAANDAARLASLSDRGVEGEVRIALSEGMAFYLLAPALPRLRERHEGLRISMVVSTRIADLTRREADLAIRFVRPSSGDLVARRAFAGEYALFGSPDLLARLGPSRRAVQDIDFVGWGEAQDGFGEARWERQKKLRIVARADAMTVRVAMAQAGIGAIEMAREFGSRVPGLVELDTPPLSLKAEAWLVTHRALQDVPRVRAVWDFVEELLALE